MKQVRNHIGALVEKNSLIDEGDGFIRVKGGLTLTDDNVQHNGTKYDIPSLSIEEYDGRLFADHGSENGYTIDKIIGKLTGVTKKGKRVFAEGVQYAVNESPLALFAYNMVKGGFLSDFSIGTMGPPPDDEGIYRNASIFEVSQVGVGNHPNARINQVAINTIEQAKDSGLDTSELEQLLHINAAEKPKSVNNINEETNMSAPEKTDDKQPVEPATNAAPAAVKSDPAPAIDADALKDSLTAAVNEAVKPLQEKIDSLEQNAFDKGAKEPAFSKDNKTPATNGGGSISIIKNEFANMDWQDRAALQVNSAWDALKGGRREAMDKLHAINLYHLDDLKKEGLVKNSMTISDFGNFVISREMLSEIQGCRNDYQALVNATQWKETLSTQMAWLNRSGDIDMTNVEFCDDDADGNLKPISEYTATIRTADLEELAAVTPVCNAATRFLAADLLGDVARGYRNDYDRKRAQLVVARLEQAVDANGNSVVYDVNPQIGGVTAFLDLWMEVATCTPDGTFIMSVSSYAEFVKQAVTAGISGPLAQLVTTGNQNTIFGRPYILVPDDLMPKLNTAQTKTFVVDGANVTINHAVFYARPDNFTGRVSGGLQYDLSTEAAYEQGESVKSAFQRNELVLRGSFFRGGAVLDNNQVAGILSPGVS